MKPPKVSIIIVLTATRILRVEFGDVSGVKWKEAPRRAGLRSVDALREGLSLGPKPGREVWVLSDDVFTQHVVLNPVQVAGLTRDQLHRALSFEVEPFSGIPVEEAVVGFCERGGGAFDVAEMPRQERDGMVAVLKDAGIKLAGVAQVAPLPAEDHAWHAFLEDVRDALEGGATPVVRPPAPQPSPYRFVALGIGLGAGALGLILALSLWNALQSAIYSRANEELGLAARDLAAVNQQKEALRKELTNLSQQENQRRQLQDRRSALAALLRGLSTVRQDDMLIRGMTAEGTSTLIVTGISLEPQAVDEFSVVLGHSLRAAGWTAQLRQKTGLRRLANGGPWEFSLAFTHEEALVRAASNTSSTD